MRKLEGNNTERPASSFFGDEDTGPKQMVMSEQLGLWDKYEARNLALFEELFPNFEKRVSEIINGFVDSSQLTDEAKAETVKNFKEIRETTNQGTPEIIRSFTNFQIARTLTMVLSDFNEITPGELEVAQEYLTPPTLDIETVLRRVDDEILQTKRDCIDYSLRFGVMPPHAAYYDPTGWVGLVEQHPYRRNHDAAEKLIRGNNARFVDIAMPKKAKRMIMSDLGPATGPLTLITCDTALKGRDDIEFDEYIVDESMAMLFFATTNLIQKYTNYLLILARTPDKKAIHRKWLSPLIDVLRAINFVRAKNDKLRQSENMAYLTSKLEKILKQFVKQNNEKFKLKNPDESTDTSDKDVKPFVHPDLMTEEDIEKRSKHVAEYLKVLIARMLSLHKYDHYEEILKIDETPLPLRIHPIQTTFDKLDFSSLQASPEVGVLHHIYGNTPNNAEDPEEFLREIVYKKLLSTPETDDDGNILYTNYCVIGVQIRKGRAHPGMLRCYDTEPSRNFVGSLFLDPKTASYYDPENNYSEIEDLNEVFDIEFGFESAPGKPKLLRIAPRLVFKKDVVIKYSNDLNETKHIESGTDILLIPINRPTMWQWEEFCHRTDIQIVDRVEDESFDTEVVHFLVRRKTKKEREEYQSILERRERNQKRRASQKIANPDDEEEAESDD